MTHLGSAKLHVRNAERQQRDGRQGLPRRHDRAVQKERVERRENGQRHRHRVSVQSDEDHGDCPAVFPRIRPTGRRVRRRQ